MHGRRVPIGQLLGVRFIGWIELGRLNEVRESSRFVRPAPEVVGAARKMAGLVLRRTLQLSAPNRGVARAIPALGGHEAPLRGLPQLAVLRIQIAGLRVCVPGLTGVVELFVELAESLEERRSRRAIGDAGRIGRDDFRGAIERPDLREHLGRGRDRLVVLRRQVRDALPRVRRRREDPCASFRG